ncbi:MAG: hypothetical protein Q4A34_03465 [Candidatus Saccharibacteria bacterium]|nr:hypothetical protein [Candidatus Saccharibacteria bacterium]
MSVRAEVDALLQMYDEYKKIARQCDLAERAVVKARFVSGDLTAAEANLETSRSRLQCISDAMTFDTPLIWVMYKAEAYTEEPQSILTLHDFRLHCAKPGYICTKRFAFLNQCRVRRGETPFSDETTYPDAMQLNELYDELALLERDASLLRQWRAYEYYQENGVVKKWQTYSSEPRNS